MNLFKSVSPTYLVSGLTPFILVKQLLGNLIFKTSFMPEFNNKQIKALSIYPETTDCE
jgi:hypothetical protein